MKQSQLNLIRIALLIGGIVLVSAGIATGEYVSVLQKSIRICLECIGIG